MDARTVRGDGAAWRAHWPPSPRPALCGEADFSVAKRKGFCHNREMLTGVMEQTMSVPHSQPWYACPLVHPATVRKRSPLVLNQHDPVLATFFPAAFSFARRLYDQLPVLFEHSWSGVTQQQAEQLAGVPLGTSGIFYPHGGWLSPSQLTSNVLEFARLHRVTQLTRQDDNWTLHFAQ